MQERYYFFVAFPVDCCRLVHGPRSGFSGKIGCSVEWVGGTAWRYGPQIRMSQKPVAYFWITTSTYVFQYSLWFSRRVKWNDVLIWSPLSFTSALFLKYIFECHLTKKCFEKSSFDLPRLPVIMGAVYFEHTDERRDAYPLVILIMMK